MQSENAKKMQPQNTSAKKMKKKKANKNANKNASKNAKKNANCMFFAFFGGGFVRASNFSKIVKNLGKMQKKMRKKCEKNTKKIKQMQIAFFCIFWRGFVRASNFSKIAKNLGKMQQKCKNNAKKCKKNAKQMQKKMRKTCKFWKCACFTKTNFQKLHFFCMFALHVFCIFFAFSWAKVFGVALSGCIFFCILIKFYNL